MGLKAIYCNNDVLEPTMAKPGERASASSDFSLGKDIIGYAAVMAAIAAVSGCVSSTTTTVTETKPEVQHSASPEGKPTPAVTTTTPVTNQGTITTETPATTTVTTYDPTTFEVPKEHEPLPRDQVEHLFNKPGEYVGVSVTRREDGVRSEFWVVYEGISKVDGETVKAIELNNGVAKTIDVPHYVANFDIWSSYTGPGNGTLTGPRHVSIETTNSEFKEERAAGTGAGASVGLEIKAMSSGNNNDYVGTCKFIEFEPLYQLSGPCFASDGGWMDAALTKWVEYYGQDEAKGALSDHVLNDMRTILKYDSENPQGYAIVTIETDG